MESTGTRVAQLWRYPVKSMAGERLEQARVGELGIEGDRGFGLVDRDTGIVLTARRVPELLLARPLLDGGRDRPRIELPDGTVTDSDDVLSSWLGRRVELRRPRPGERGRYEVARNDDRPDGEWVGWEGPAGVFHDSARVQLSLTSEAALGGWDVRRFRPNVVLAGGDERDLVHRRVRVGDVELAVVKEIGRCVVVTRAQPGLERDKGVLVRVHRDRGGKLGVGALVRATGTIAVGDAVERVG
ncbi:MAG TPA: MOSC N-terminal beta barrel domain-containing protein [Acidimicrobiales bacterium]|nr:MOSC N-terminal beta barrel domain-containing protein [Acidimicrobiales bacterium]